MAHGSHKGDSEEYHDDPGCEIHRGFCTQPRATGLFLRHWSEDKVERGDHEGESHDGPEAELPADEERANLVNHQSQAVANEQLETHADPSPLRRTHLAEGGRDGDQARRIEEVEEHEGERREGA